MTISAKRNTRSVSRAQVLPGMPKPATKAQAKAQRDLTEIVQWANGKGGPKAPMPKALRAPAKPVPVKGSWTRKAKAPKAQLTPGQKAAATKARNGLNLSAIAKKAHETRRANKLARAKETAKLARAQARSSKAREARA